MDRRTFMNSAAASLAALGRRSRPRWWVCPPQSEKLVVVFVQGGWDITRVFADGFDHSGVDMEPDAERDTAGGIDFIAHSARPSVSSFMAANHARTLVLNGVMVRSIAHEICTTIALTGDTSGLMPDWPAIAGSSMADTFTLPHLVLGGPNFAGDLGTAVARSGSAGQLEGLLSGDILAQADGGVHLVPKPAPGIIDRYLARTFGGPSADGIREGLDHGSASAPTRPSVERLSSKTIVTSWTLPPRPISGARLPWASMRSHSDSAASPWGTPAGASMGGTPTPKTTTNRLPSGRTCSAD